VSLSRPREKKVEIRGIPHLAKNERDMGHPGFVVRLKAETTMDGPRSSP
jgi:hypothetical protein